MVKRIPILLAIVCAQVPAMASEPVDLADPSPEWATVFEALQQPGSIKTCFAETRRNPFHRLPRRFAGVIRWVPDRGLSIHYTEPREVIIAVTPESITITRDGESRRESFMEEDGGFLTLIPRLLAWDMAWLSQHFIPAGDISGEDGWELTLSPSGKLFSESISRMVLNGNGGMLQTITLHARGGRIIEIRLLETAIDPAFTPEELEQAFPAHDE